MLLLKSITRSQKKKVKNWTIHPLNYLIYNLVILLKKIEDKDSVKDILLES
jgi:hypothetical protein